MKSNDWYYIFYQHDSDFDLEEKLNKSLREMGTSLEEIVIKNRDSMNYDIGFEIEGDDSFEPEDEPA